ncbi:MAG: phosphomannomutase [Vicingaceae bacterium]|jgi:phosphomannomutase
MTLIKSISGIRGTIGGVVGENLTPEDIVKFASAYGQWIINRNTNSSSVTIVIGRDARISGAMLNRLVVGTLQGLGIHVIDIGLSTTPTVEIAVPLENANGGIILTASHNPKEWNALKLLNEKGEFISAKDGADLLDIAEKGGAKYQTVGKLGTYITNDTYFKKHVDHVLGLELVNKEAIAKKNFRIIIDCVNSTGGIVIPMLLKALGVTEVIELYCEPNGNFPHNPEPLPENLTEISAAVKKHNADLGIVVDPDVDRLALVSEDGEMFGEEYTLVAVADYVLQHTKGSTVSNLSSTRALRDVTESLGCEYFASSVGEVNVVDKMKEVHAIIGGEGNGGVIYPVSHYGRDALVGIGLFLSHLATFKGKTQKACSELRASYNSYYISKNKIELTPEINVDDILIKIQEKYKNQPVNTIDGVKIEFDKEWVHLRKSNTEPIIRIYSESESETTANHLAEKIISDIREIIKA